MPSRRTLENLGAIALLLALFFADLEGFPVVLVIGLMYLGAAAHSLVKLIRLRRTQRSNSVIGEPPK